MKIGSMVTTLARVLSEPPIERGNRCKVIAMSSDNQKVFLEGPAGQVVQLPRGDVYLAKK